ncbi:hypothetical protein [Hahella sp. HN01]|uniref:hypothetical protein n=1 Tax=Hahella sp. HN01 TaxID=2847262 RepID=UPI001C1EC948|nr:hypothetical protein [Hahella sp. HN01]MBU6954175.1 hypothetical protein [Hahella sp. HN01]
MQSRNMYGFLLSLPSLLALLVGLSLTAAMSYFSNKQQEKDAHARFVQEAQFIAQTVRRTFEQNRAAAELWFRMCSARPESEDAATDATRVFLQGFPNISSIEHLVIAKSADDSRRFSVTDINSLQPLTLNDIKRVTELPELQPAFDEAWRSGETIATPVTRINSQNPAYRGEVRYIRRVDDMLIAISFDLEHSLKTAVVDYKPEGFTLSMFDLMRYASDPLVKLVLPPDGEENIKKRKSWLYSDTLELPERQWLLRITPNQAFHDQTNNRYTVTLFISGAIISILLSLLLARPTRKSGEADTDAEGF